MTEVELIEKAALHVGMKSLMNNGAASCVYSEGCNGVTQAHLIAFAREIALHCAVALAAPTQAAGGEAEAIALIGGRLDVSGTKGLRHIETAIDHPRGTGLHIASGKDGAMLEAICKVCNNAAAVEPRTTPPCRDCADFGPICPSSGQPCDKRAAAVTAASKAAEDIQPVCRHGVYPVIACEVCKRAAAAPEELTADLRDALWLDPECANAGACQSLRFKAATPDAKTAEARKPMTAEQIENLRGEANRGFNIERADYFKAFRDAESAHGIGDQP